MPLNEKIRICTHIKVNGHRCGSPALREEVFCYFHQRMIRGVVTPPKSRVHPIAFIEDAEGIQASLTEIINAVIRNTLDVRRAQVVLRALHIAMRNSRRVHFDTFHDSMIREVPEYPEAPPAPSGFETALAQAEALTRINQPRKEQERLDKILECERFDAAFASILSQVSKEAAAR